MKLFRTLLLISVLGMLFFSVHAFAATYIDNEAPLEQAIGTYDIKANCSERVASSDKLAEASACEIKQFDVKVIADLVARGMSEQDINALADDTPMDEVRLDRIHRWVHEALEFNSKGNLSAWVLSHTEKCE